VLTAYILPIRWHQHGGCHGEEGQKGEEGEKVQEEIGEEIALSICSLSEALAQVRAFCFFSKQQLKQIMTLGILSGLNPCPT
jgi:hypothetical protein